LFVFFVLEQKKIKITLRCYTVLVPCVVMYSRPYMYILCVCLLVYVHNTAGC